MRKLVLILSIAMILFLIFPAAIVAQTANSEEFDPEEYFARYGYITSESPVFYATRSGLAPNEMHILDTLTRAERQIIEESFDPPAIGVIRDLSEPVYFNLNEIVIPESGEISQFGGRITRVDEGLLVYTTYFQSKKADEIRLFFSEGNFPPGVKVNLFSRDDYAFTQPELRGTLDEYGFYTTTTFADYITLQVVMPITQIEENVYFTITKVIHADDRYIPEELVRSCFLDANCADANSFAHIDGFRRATARLSFPSGLRYGLCTGTQLNDLRAADWQPFLLTANHCFDTQSSAAGLEARFYYWSTSCNSGVVNPSHIIVNGSNLIATNSQTDFTLILLKEQGGNYYMGWDAGGVSNNTVMHSVHHPGGTLMKYHRMQNKTSPDFTCSGFSTSNFLYTKVTLGQEAPGSSGGGVVDPAGRIRGQLYGTCHLDEWDNCDYDTYYNMWGKFGVSYANNNLQYWLSNGGSSVAMSTSPASSYSFGTVNVGSYQNYYLTVYNTGTRPNYLNLEAGNAYISGGDASQFSIIGSTFLYLAPGESGTFTVRFTPTSSGKKTTSLNIPHNADNYSSPKVITLTGYGNPCSDIISLGGGGSQNTKTFSKSGEGAWTSNFCGYVCNGNEQIYSFTAPVTGTYSITVTSTNNTWVDYFWKPTACSSGGWNCISYFYSPSTQGLMNWTAGTTYYILLDAEQTALATHSFYVALNPCSNIISISGTGSANSKTYTGGGYGSWYTSTVSACGYYCEGQEQVYSFVAPRTGNYAVQVTSGGSWVDYMWKSGSCASSGWQCIDDIYSPGLYGEMYWNAGETYYLLLDDEDNTLSNHTFYIQLTEAVGTWTGLVNSDWHHTGNWSFNIIPGNTIDVIIPNGTPHDPIIQNTGAACKSLTIESGVVFTIGAYSLIVTTDVNVFGQLVLNNTASKLYVYQDIFWHSGATASAVGSATIFVQRTWDFLEGCNVYLNAGYVDFFGTEPGYIRSRDADSYFNHVRNNKTGTELGHSAQSLQPCRLHGNLYIYSNCSFTSYTSQSFIIGSFVNNMSGSIHLDSGTFVFDGGSGTSHFMPGDYFNNITFSATGTTTFDDNIEIRGDVLIESGSFNPGSTTLTVKGNWTNTAGSSAFTESTSRVIFNGTGHNYVKTSETFNILEANMGAALRVDNASSVVTCNQYDWTSGGIDVMAGTFTALDLYDNGIFGGFWLNPGGTINLTNSDGYVDLAGNVNIYGGNFNVYGGTTDSYWPWSSNASITMSAGVLDFKDVGIYVNSISSYTLTENITDGAIKTSGNFYNENPVFTPSGGTVELYGSTDVGITNNAGTYLHNLTINKSGGSDEGSEPLVTRDRNGKTIVLSRANQVTLNSDIFINGNLTVNAGKLNMGNAGYDLTCMGNASIENGATLEMLASSQLRLNTSMTVKNGGTFRSTGAAGLESWVTRAVTNRYLFQIQSGANIGASNTIFEYMGVNGVNIASGAVVDPAQAFNNCTFRQGLSANTLLTINSTQSLECSGAIFPANTWGGTNNVKKSVNSGQITFYDYSGGFAGSAYESDPYNRIMWMAETQQQNILLAAGWQGLSSYIMPTDNNIENVFAPLSPNFIIAQTMSGIYYPAGPINTIGTWMSQSAYTVKMENAAWLSIFGMPETDKTYDLTAGWNLIPVIANNPVNVATLPTTVGFQIVKEVAGTGIYWPAMSINTLGNLLPGKAYYVRVTSGGTITFPANTDAGWDGKYPEATLLQTPWNQSVASPVSHLVAFAPGATAELVAGDIIGLFTPDNICCGVALVEMPAAPMAITAFADDAQQPGTSGYLSGQTISLKIYRTATNEVGMLTAVYEPAGNGDVFADHGLSVITRIQQTATGIGTISTAAVDIYPNPTNGTITITGIGQYSLLQLYSAHGELLLQRTNDAADELRWDVSALPPGVYQLKLSGNHPAVVKKLIRN